MQTSAELIADLRSDLTSWEAAEQLWTMGTAADVPAICEVFWELKSWPIRAELLDLIRKLAKSDACDFLRSVVRSRSHYMVRYDACRNLIDLEGDGWQPSDRRLLRSDFYQSLIYYEKFLRGEISRETLSETARQRTKWPGDHWRWLTEPAQ